MRAEYSFQLDGETKTVGLEQMGEHVTITIDDRTYQVTLPLVKQGRLHFVVDGQQLQASVAKGADKWYIHLAGQQWELAQPAGTRSRRGAGAGATGADSGVLTATMPSQVLDVLVEVGDSVSRGQALLLLEAMKMELRLTAPFEGIVQQIHCTPGQTVDRDQPLVEVSPVE